jgi:glucose 1-dehydrogenase
VRPGVSTAAVKIIFTSSVHELIPWAGRVNNAAVLKPAQKKGAAP